MLSPKNETTSPVSDKLLDKRGVDFFNRICGLVSRVQPFVSKTQAVYCVRFTFAEKRNVSLFQGFVATVTATVHIDERDFKITLLPVFPRVRGIHWQGQAMLHRPTLEDRMMPRDIYEMRLPQEAIELLGVGLAMDWVCFSFGSESKRIPLQELLEVQFDLI